MPDLTKASDGIYTRHRRLASLGSMPHRRLHTFLQITHHVPSTVCNFLVMAVTISKFKCHFGPGAFLASPMIVLSGRIIGYWSKIFLSATTRWQSLLVSHIVKRESRERDSWTHAWSQKDQIAGAGTGKIPRHLRYNTLDNELTQVDTWRSEEMVGYSSS